MNPIKITIATIVVGVICTCIFFWRQNIKDPEKIKQPENQFTQKIEQQIDELITKPDNKFCKDFYIEVVYHINEFYKQNRFGSNQLENEFVNNCARLHNGLKEIPQSLFSAQVKYLDSKINSWSGLYSNYNSQSDYSNNLYKPLKFEIEALDNDIYNVSNFDSEYERLLQKWSADNTKAFYHIY